MAAQSVGRAAADFIGYLLLFRAAPESQRPSLGALRNHLLGLLDALAKRTDPQTLPEAELDEIRFALVSWADEVIMHSDWSGVQDWKRESLAVLLLHTARAGNEFFEHLQRLRPDQLAAREIYYLCLALGFEGEYVGNPSERTELIRQNYEILRREGRAVDAEALKQLAPPAYDYVITLERSRGRRVWPLLLWIALGTLAIWGVLYVLLRFAADGVPAPPGVAG